MPQGSVLGPLLFLLFMNDITHVVNSCNIRLFADDTCLFIEVDNRDAAAEQINRDLESIHNWSKTWLVTFSSTKTKTLMISNKKDTHLNPPVSFNTQLIEEVTSHTYLGLKFSSNLRWNNHIHDISLKARQRLNLMIPLKYKLNRTTLETMYNAFVLPTMEYGIVVWGGTYDSDMAKLERIHADGMRLVTGATARSNIANLFEETKWQRISQRRDHSMQIMLYKIKNQLAPSYLFDLIPPENQEYIRYNLRNNSDIAVPQIRLESYRRSFVPFAISLWNQLTLQVRNLKSIEIFKNHITDNKKCNILYYYGQRWPSVHHSRIRIGCSKLNYDLHFNLHVVEDPICDCRLGEEDAFHYFFKCPNYDDIRLKLFSCIAVYSIVNLDTLLHGNSDLDIQKNNAIFGAVHDYITSSKRFI